MAESKPQLDLFCCSFRKYFTHIWGSNIPAAELQVWQLFYNMSLNLIYFSNNVILYKE